MTDYVTHAVNLTIEEYDVYIGRPSRWGNPFQIGRDGTSEEVIEKYRNWVLNSDDPKAVWVREHVGELKGKRLGCFCKGLPCHGDLLAELAEASVQKQHDA